MATLVAAHRRMSPRDKMRRVLACNAAVEAMAIAGLRAREGALSDRELRLRLAALRLGRETMRAAFGWDDEKAAPSGDG
jgi:hypothetical protein